MIDSFMVGKSYRWIGPEKPSSAGIPEELSKIWEQGESHKCLSAKTQTSVSFYGIYTEYYPNSTYRWAYAGYQNNFELVK